MKTPIKCPVTWWLAFTTFLLMSSVAMLIGNSWTWGSFLFIAAMGGVVRLMLARCTCRD